MLAGLQRRDRSVAVKRRRRGDGDDIARRKQRIARLEALSAVRVGKLLRALIVRIVHADELHAGVFRILPRMDAPEGARAEHACAKLAHSTVTDLARLRGWSTSVPLCTAVKYASSWIGTE